MFPKISLIGAGNIGATLAHIILAKNFGSVKMFDIAEMATKGKTLDLKQASLKRNISSHLDYSELKDSDVIVVTAGLPRQPGMSRDELLNINSKIIKEVADGVKKHSPHSFVIVLTNPLDVMVYLFQKYSGLRKNMVVGMAGVLDSARFRSFLGEKISVSADDIHTLILGGHGDSMVPLLSHTSVSGIPLTEYQKIKKISQQDIDAIVKRTRYGGGEIVELLQKGSAFYAPAQAAFDMIKSYVLDEKRLMCCAAYVEEYEQAKNMYVGVPVVIGSSGVEDIVKLNLSESEKNDFNESVESVRVLLNNV
jgi:malate dehydrogenase